MPASKHRPEASWPGDHRQVATWQRAFAAKTTTQNSEATDEHVQNLAPHKNIEHRPSSCHEDLQKMPPWTRIPGAQVLAPTITEHPVTFEEAKHYRTLPQQYKQARRAGYVLST